MGWALASNSDDDTGLDLRILGPLEVLRDGQTVALGGRRQRAVLARLLVAANRVVPAARPIGDRASTRLLRTRTSPHRAWARGW